jgi:hypothetical protein
MRYVEHDFIQGLLTSQTAIDQALTAYLDSVYTPHRRLSMTELQSRMENVLKLSFIRQRLGLNYGLSRADRRETSELDMDLFRTVLLEARPTCSVRLTGVTVESEDMLFGTMAPSRRCWAFRCVRPAADDLPT